MINAYNIDSFMTPFLRILYDGITYTFDMMSRFEFGGTNLLQVMITIMILGVAIPILLSLSINLGTGDNAENYKPRHGPNSAYDRFAANSGIMTREYWRTRK